MYSLSKIPKHFFSTEIKGKNSSSNFKSIYKKNNNKLTELNHLILDFMKENKDKYDNSFSSKIIAEGLDTAAKKISGSIRKLVNLGLVEKTNENPVIYALRED